MKRPDGWPGEWPPKLTDEQRARLDASFTGTVLVDLSRTPPANATALKVAPAPADTRVMTRPATVLVGLVAVVSALGLAACASTTSNVTRPTTSTTVNLHAQAGPGIKAKEATACRVMLAHHADDAAANQSLTVARGDATGTRLADLIDTMQDGYATGNAAELDRATTLGAAECHWALGR